MLLTTIIIFLAIMVVIVVAHELGHLLVAKGFRVAAPEFGIGFPPRICKLFEWRGTQFVLNWLPIGGYVNLAGEDALAADEACDSKRQKTAATEARGDELFYRKPAWQRLAVIAAGPLANFALAAVIFTIVYAVAGVPERREGWVLISEVATDSPADIARLEPGMRLLTAIDLTGAEYEIKDVNEFVSYVSAHAGQNISLVVREHCQNFACGEKSLHTLTIRTIEETPAGEGAMGVILTDTMNVHYDGLEVVTQSLWAGARESYYFARDILTSLARAVAGWFGPEKAEVELVGPVGIVSQLNQARTFERGWIEIWSFAAILSVNLGVVNLLPIPAVDGGRLVLIALEKIIGRQRVARAEAIVNYIGLIAVLGLMALITGRDIWRIWTGG